jgi:hypothetical protein
MVAFITPPGPKRRFWSLLTPLTLSKEFTLKLPLRREARVRRLLLRPLSPHEDLGGEGPEDRCANAIAMTWAEREHEIIPLNRNPF